MLENWKSIPEGSGKFSKSVPLLSVNAGLFPGCLSLTSEFPESVPRFTPSTNKIIQNTMFTRYSLDCHRNVNRYPDCCSFSSTDSVISIIFIRRQIYSRLQSKVYQSGISLVYILSPGCSASNA